MPGGRESSSRGELGFQSKNRFWGQIKSVFTLPVFSASQRRSFWRAYWKAGFNYIWFQWCEAEVTNGSLLCSTAQFFLLQGLFPWAEVPVMVGLKMSTSAGNFPFLSGVGGEEDAIVVPYTLWQEGWGESLCTSVSSCLAARNCVHCINAQQDVWTAWDMGWCSGDGMEELNWWCWAGPKGSLISQTKASPMEHKPQAHSGGGIGLRWDALCSQVTQGQVSEPRTCERGNEISSMWSSWDSVHC